MEVAIVVGEPRTRRPAAVDTPMGEVVEAMEDMVAMVGEEEAQEVIRRTGVTIVRPFVEVLADMVDMVAEVVATVVGDGAEDGDFGWKVNSLLYVAFGLILCYSIELRALFRAYSCT